MMAEPQPLGCRSALRKQHPGGPCVNTAGWHLKPFTEAYETSEDNRMAATKPHWWCFMFLPSPVPWPDKLAVTVIEYRMPNRKQ